MSADRIKKEGDPVSQRGAVQQELAGAEEFTPEQLAKADAIIAKYKGKPGSLIPVLEDIQEAIGYLPKEIQKKVALGLRIPLGEIYGVVTFYHFFTMVPKGRNIVRVCLGTACYVGGGAQILDLMTGNLKLQPGQTTPDRRFTLETVRCLGCCGLAPVVVINEDTHRQVKVGRITRILEGYE
jgi:NADH:ubiquinone oxidoreductase subunit E